MIKAALNAGGVGPGFFGPGGRCVKKTPDPFFERGVALVTALVVVALVTTLAASISFGQQLWLRQAQNQRDRAQALAVEQGAIEWAAIIVKRDGGNADHLGEDWAQPLPPLPAEGGVVQGTIRDAQGRFNLNSLWRGNGQSTDDITVFERLLSALGLDTGLTQALIDWRDPDSLARPGGADDIEYLAGKPSYRAANRPLESVEELRLIRGFDAEAVAKLRPYVTALREPTAINVNTAPAMVLSALLNLPLSEAERLVQARDAKKGGLSNNQDLEKLLPQGAALPGQGLFGFQTDYFDVRVASQFGRVTRRTEALLHRASNKVEIRWKGQRLI